MDGRPCERCGNFDQLHGGSPQEDWDNQEEERIPALCSEVQMAFGLLGWLCHDCRKEYHRMAKDHPLTEKYGEACLSLEFWKARVGSETPEDDLQKGLELWRTVEGLERKVNQIANEWLLSDVDAQRSH